MNDWHLVHLGSFAKGGAAVVCLEATAVQRNGRITPYCSGIWKDEHIVELNRMVRFIHEHQSLAAIQLAHAGRKAGTLPPFILDGHNSAIDEWEDPVVGPSRVPFSEKYKVPDEITKVQIKEVIQAFVDAAKRAEKAGFDIIEIHGAHGYLISSFLSPIANKRTDEYGGTFEGRIRFALELLKAVRSTWPKDKPLFFRVSCTDWYQDGWTPDETVKLAREIKELQIDAIDCSSGGNTPLASIPAKPGYQVPFSARIKKEVTGILTCALGILTDPHQCEDILQKGEGDIICMAREFLREPFWPLKAAQEFNLEVEWAPQYERARRVPKL